MKSVVALAAVLLALAGCSSGSDKGPLSQAEAESVAADALQAMPGELAGDGALTLLEAEMAFDDEDFGKGTMTFTLRFGQGGAMHMKVVADADGFQFTAEVWCNPDGEWMSFFGTTYESRSQGTCDDTFGDEEAFSGDFDFTSMLLADATDDLEVTPNPDGTVTVAFSDDEARIKALIGTDGRVHSMDIDADEGSGTVTFTYGKKAAITPPEADERMPSSVSASCWLQGGSCTATAFGGDDAPLVDFEVRIHQGGSGAPTAVFPLTPGDATQGGYTFHFEDDGDGLFGDGDAFTVTGPDAEVVVWDRWADRSIDDVGAPGLPLVALLAALVGAARLRR